MRDRALASPAPVFVVSQVVAAPAASEPSLVLRGAVDEFGVNRSVDGEVTKLLQARDENVQFRKRTLVIAGHANSVPAADIEHVGLLVMCRAT